MKRETMNQGDYVLLESGMLHAVGRYGVGAAVIIGDPFDTSIATFDVCLMGQHLPQMYRLTEVSPLDDVDLVAHGLCFPCKGWGLTSLRAGATVEDIVDGKAGIVCSVCGGSGRKGVLVTSIRTATGVDGRVDVASDATDGVTCPLCVKVYSQ